MSSLLNTFNINIDATYTIPATNNAIIVAKIAPVIRILANLTTTFGNTCANPAKVPYAAIDIINEAIKGLIKVFAN